MLKRVIRMKGNPDLRRTLDALTKLRNEVEYERKVHGAETAT
jgi:hypothetical protein